MMAAFFLVSLDAFFFCHSLGILYPNRLFLQAKKRKARVPRDADEEPLRRSGRLANLPEKPMYREVSVKGS